MVRQIISDEPEFEGLTDGVYTLVVEDKDGCMGHKTIQIEQGTHIDCCELILDAALTHTSLPEASDGSIDLSLTLGEGTTEELPYTYQWYQPGIGSLGNTEDINGLAVGEYCVDVFDNRGCTASLCVEIEPQQCVEDWLEFYFIKTIPTSHTDNDDGAIRFFRKTTRNVSYEWSGLSSIEEEELTDSYEWYIRNLSAGLYCLTITDLDYGCVQEECAYVIDGCTLYEDNYVLVGPDPASIRPETPLGYGGFGPIQTLEKVGAGQATLMSLGLGYGAIYFYEQSTGNTPVYNEGYPAGIYCLKRPFNAAHDDLPGDNEICLENTPEYCFEIPYDPNPCATRVIDAEVIGNCMTDYLSIPWEGSITLQLSTDEYGWVEPITYLWDDPWNSTTSQLNNLLNGTYCVTVSDVENCSKTECFEVGNQMEVEITVVPYCVGYPGSIEVEVLGTYTPPLSYSWTGQNEFGFPGTFLPGSSVFDDLYAGNYCVKVEDAEGCVFKQCDIWVSYEQITEGSQVDGSCYKELYCGGTHVVDVVPAEFTYEPIPHTCNARILCNGEPTGGVQLGVELDSWYVIMDNRPGFFESPIEGCGNEEEETFGCWGCKKWMECSPGGHVEVPDAESFEIEVYDFEFVETECNEDEKEIFCGFL